MRPGGQSKIQKSMSNCPTLCLFNESSTNISGVAVPHPTRLTPGHLFIMVWLPPAIIEILNSLRGAPPPGEGIFPIPEPCTIQRRHFVIATGRRGQDPALRNIPINYNLALYWVKPINTFIFTVISFFNAGKNGYATFVKKSQRSIQRER